MARPTRARASTTPIVQTDRLGFIDSPLGTSVNNAACVVGVVAAAANGFLILVAFIGGPSLLPVATFPPFIALALPLFLWATAVLTWLRGSERERKGLPRRRSVFRGDFGNWPFMDLPKGFLCGRDFAAMGAAAVIAFATFSQSRDGSSPPTRSLLGLSFVFLVFASTISLAEHRRRCALHLPGVRSWPAPSVPPPRIARSRAVIASLLLVGISLAGIGGTVSALRSNQFQYGEARLTSGGTTTIWLPGGDNVIFVGYLGEHAPAPFTPAQVTVIGATTDGRVPTRWDPSSDHDSPYDIPSLGLVSFTTPRDGRYRISVAGPSHLKLFVGRDLGSQARLLIGWIALFVVGIGIVVTGVIALNVRIKWRYRTVTRAVVTRPQSIEEWMAQGDVHG